MKYNLITFLVNMIVSSMVISFAKVTGPLMSLSASGTIAKTLTYGIWRGVQWVREHFVPTNPQTEKQVNVRTAWTLAVEEWTDTITQAQKDAYDVGAEGQKYSGENLWMSRAMDEYIDQLGSTTTPVSVGVTGNYPDDEITWSDS